MQNSSDEILMMLRFAVSRDMLTVSAWVLYCGGRWKCGELALQAGGSHRMWIGFCNVMDLGATSGQMRVILFVAAEGAEVRIHIFGAIDVGTLILLVFLI